jgi:aryl-alcohol dehydrogenase-like predicted oxidoreductase
MEQQIGILVRGPLNKGILSGRYTLDTEFTDTVRKGWNKGGDKRGDYEQRMRALEKIKAEVGDADLVETALWFIISHPANMVVIPGATRPAQVISNADAGKDTLDADTMERLAKLG